MTSALHPSPLTPHGFFITGTDTGVGKTYAACLLIESLKRRGLRVAAMKPVAAGVGADGVNEDVRLLMAAANVRAPRELVNPYCPAPAIAPHIAAQQAGVSMSLDRIADAYARLAAQADVVVMEGAGGFLVPLNGACGMDEIPRRLKLPVVMVVGLRLGCLTHALLTEEAIRARGLPLAGWIANGIDPDMEAAEENLDSLRNILRSPCLGEIPPSGSSIERAADSVALILKAVGLDE